MEYTLNHAMLRELLTKRKETALRQIVNCFQEFENEAALQAFEPRKLERHTIERLTAMERQKIVIYDRLLECGTLEEILKVIDTTLKKDFKYFYFDEFRNMKENIMSGTHNYIYKDIEGMEISETLSIKQFAQRLLENQQQTKLL